MNNENFLINIIIELGVKENGEIMEIGGIMGIKEIEEIGKIGEIGEIGEIREVPLYPLIPLYPYTFIPPMTEGRSSIRIPFSHMDIIFEIYP